MQIANDVLPTPDFNSRPSARGDKMEIGLLRISLYFNSRPSARGDLSGEDIHDSISLFQFTPLREGRLAGTFDYEKYQNFNSRPSARGDVRDGTVSGGGDYFNSRPSARGDWILHDVRTRFPISIHAPPRGATYRLRLLLYIGQFQFTPLREGRRDDGKIDNMMNRISIHAPPRGATAAHLHRRKGSRISIHAPPRGATGA